MGSYVPSAQDERSQMLEKVGLTSFDALFQQVPAEVRVNRLNLPDGKSELEVAAAMEEMASKNKVFRSIFRGAGAYCHYIPAIVKSVATKEEFLTSYTPYQAEISQGILQSIFEYQTMICELTGLDASNASIYDGASAAAEAVSMCRDRKRTKAYISAAVNPMVLQTIKTYCEGADTEVIVVPLKDGITDLDALGSMLGSESACVYLQQPNYYGLLEDADRAAEVAHTAGAKLIMGVNPIALAVVKTPGECGADVAVGEGQPLGMALSFGGPYLGFMACTTAMMRKLPGRIVGETVDIDGKRAYVLTLQAREQHIRREKASSNVCSNQALCALTASVYMAAMGGDGLCEVARQCMSKAKYAADAICSVEGFSLIYNGQFFHEFLTTCPVDREYLLGRLEEKGILGGLPVEDGILWCVTEMNSKGQIDALAETLREVCRK